MAATTDDLLTVLQQILKLLRAQAVFAETNSLSLTAADRTKIQQALTDLKNG